MKDQVASHHSYSSVMEVVFASKKEDKVSLEEHVIKERKFILYIVVMFMINVEKMMSKTAHFTSNLSVRKQIMEVQKGDFYNGELVGSNECMQG